MQNDKYRLEPASDGLFRLIAVRDIGGINSRWVEAGQVGGLVDKHVVLSDKDESWIYQGSAVTGAVFIHENSYVMNNSVLHFGTEHTGCSIKSSSIRGSTIDNKFTPICISKSIIDRSKVISTYDQDDETGNEDFPNPVISIDDSVISSSVIESRVISLYGCDITYTDFTGVYLKLKTKSKLYESTLQIDELFMHTRSTVALSKITSHPGTNLIINSDSYVTGFEGYHIPADAWHKGAYIIIPEHAVVRGTSSHEPHTPASFHKKSVLTITSAFDYKVTITDDHIQVGCQNYTVEEWKSFSKDQIEHMDGDRATEYYTRVFPALYILADAR